MKTTSTINRRHRQIATAFVAIIASIVIGGAAAAAQTDPPPWIQCVYADHPVAADVGGILPVNFVPSPELLAALLGQIKVGTDCSIYDLSDLDLPV